MDPSPWTIWRPSWGEAQPKQSSRLGDFFLVLFGLFVTEWGGEYDQHVYYLVCDARHLVQNMGCPESSLTKALDTAEDMVKQLDLPLETTFFFPPKRKPVESLETTLFNQEIRSKHKKSDACLSRLALLLMELLGGQDVLLHTRGGF